MSHDVHNTSDHDPIFLYLNLAVNNVKLSTRVFTPRVSWVKASVQDCDKYRSVLSYKLHNIDLPYAALLRSDFMCSKCDHKNAISLYAEAITDACLSAADSCIPRTCHPQKSGQYPGGLNVLHHSVKNPYSGTNYGLTVAAQGLGPSLILIV